MADREALKLLVTEHTCERKCMGFDGNSGGCCTLGPRDYIIGPVEDVDLLLERLSVEWGRPVTRGEVVIDYEEGRALFPERAVWQHPSHYPAMRVLTEHPRVPCRFYDLERSRCTIYAIRPPLCRRFECDWLKETLGRL